MDDLEWKIKPTKKLEKQINSLPKQIRPTAYALLDDIEKEGPKQINWPNYSKLTNKKKKIPINSFHCHLKKGKPTYVACWCIIDEDEKIIEVFYVGTHENAPY